MGRARRRRPLCPRRVWRRPGLARRRAPQPPGAHRRGRHRARRHRRGRRPRDLRRRRRRLPRQVRPPLRADRRLDHRRRAPRHHPAAAAPARRLTPEHRNPKRSDMSTNDDVLVITGAGGIGQAIARRQGPGKHILFADISEDNQAAAAAALEDLGHRVSTRRVDVSSRESVHALAAKAAELGNVIQVVHTAGVSPVQAPAATVLAVDLLGTALVLEEFGRVIAPGGAGIVISSMAAHMSPPFDPEQEHALAHTPTDELLALPFLDPEGMGGAAYGYAKRGNHLRVQAESLLWGERGARVNAISPGIIITPLARDEMSGPGAANYRKMIETSAIGRVGTPDEVAAAAAFLLGPEAGFITGSDLLMDGGVIAALRAGRWRLGA